MSLVTEKLPAYSGESRTWIFDFRDYQEMLDADTLASVNSVTALPSSLTVGSTAIVGQTVHVVLSGGTSGVSYVVTCTVTTASGAILIGRGGLEMQ